MIGNLGTNIFSTLFGIRIVGADAVAIGLSRLVTHARDEEYRIIRHYALLYQTRVRARASGRPGPRAITGDYRRSITVSLKRGREGTTAEIYSTRPQARRLELGFMNMTDSLGRTFHQPPLPHWEPDLQRTVDEMHQALADAILRVA